MMNSFKNLWFQYWSLLPLKQSPIDVVEVLIGDSNIFLLSVFD